MIWLTHTTTIPTSPNGIAHRIEGQIKKPLVVQKINLKITFTYMYCCHFRNTHFLLLQTLTMT